MDVGVHLCLLRGINVGGKSAVAMSNLRTAFEDLGLAPVRTHGNTGNVLFAAPKGGVPTEEHLDDALTSALGLPTRVFLRTLREVRAVVEHIPADWGEDREHHRDIMFLRSTIDRPGIVDELKPKPEVESLTYRPGVLYWSVSVRNYGRSGVSKMVGTDLYKSMTIRGPRPVRRIDELMQAMEDELRG